MNRQIGSSIAEITRELSFGTSGLVAREQVRQFKNNLADKIAERLVPPEPVLTQYQQAEYRRMCQEDEKRISLYRQVEIDEYYDMCRWNTEKGLPLPSTTARQINEKWVAELCRRNAKSKRFCSTSVPSQPVKPLKPGFFGVWGSFFRYCLSTLF